MDKNENISAVEQPTGDLTDEQIIKMHDAVFGWLDDGYKFVLKFARNIESAAIAAHLARQPKAEQPTIPEELDESQDWGKHDGAIAFHLIDRHTDDWADCGRMMEAWRIARTAELGAEVAPAGAQNADLHNAIMNIPHKRADSEFMNAEHRMLYKHGHRDARHAAAELAIGYEVPTAGAQNAEAIRSQAESGPVISSYDLEKVKSLKYRFVDSLIHSGVQYRTCGAISATLNQIIADSEAAANSAGGLQTGSANTQEGGAA